MSDPFASNATGFSGPARNAFSVTPNSAADLTTFCRALYIGGAGNVRVTTTGGDTVTFTGLQAGQVLPVACRRVLGAPDTTATLIVALY